jgi:hypothetical protein
VRGIKKEKTEIQNRYHPHPSLPEAVKNSEFSPSPYPLPPGERVNILKYKKKFPPPRRGRVRVGVEMGFFHTFPLEGGRCEKSIWFFFTSFRRKPEEMGDVVS